MSAGTRRKAVTDDGTPVVGACKCGAATRVVKVSGEPVDVDIDQDLQGDVHGMKIGGRWVFTLADTTAVNGPTMRYRRHRCPVTRQAELRRQLDQVDAEGPCRGYCGRRLPNVYGPGAVRLCPECQAKRDALTTR